MKSKQNIRQTSGVMNQLLSVPSRRVALFQKTYLRWTALFFIEIRKYVLYEEINIDETMPEGQYKGSAFYVK